MKTSNELKELISETFSLVEKIQNFMEQYRPTTEIE
jgi:hypothetical protein